VKKLQNSGLNFIIDKLTNSIQNVVTGDNFATDISLITMVDLRTVTKKNNWQFDWKWEFKQPQRDVYKLTIVNNQSVIQGLISLEIKSDHVYMHLVESAPFNKGKTKVLCGSSREPGSFCLQTCFSAWARGQRLLLFQDGTCPTLY
jgi:hypothetical protein